jgi:DNA end-binding protein Ku
MVEGMERSLWNGTLEIGGIVIPVAIASAVREPDADLRQIHAACKTPISVRHYCASHEKLLEPEEIVRAFELAPGGGFQTPSPDDLSAIKEPETRRIPISCFTPAAAIDPRLVKKHYHLVPSSPIGFDAYFLLVCAIAEQDVAAVVRFTWKGEKVAAIYSHEGLLDLAVLHFDEDLVVDDPRKLAAEIGVVAETRNVSDELLELARQLVYRHTRPLGPTDLASRERPRMVELRERLLTGAPIDRPVQKHKNTEPATPAPTFDLAATLKRSVKQAPPAPRKKRPTATR